MKRPDSIFTKFCLVSHGDQEICRAGVYFAMMNVFVLQLMCVLMQSQVYSVMYTAAFKKLFMDLNEEEVDYMPEDQTASADTLMVLLT